jgi:hypothetical protein
MAGFPIRPERDGFGPPLEDERPVENPRKEIGAGAFNLAWWQLAGIGRTVERVTLLGRWDGALMQNDYQAFAWDPEGLLPPIIPTRSGVGVYKVTFAANYPDETGTNRSIAIVAHGAHPQPAAGAGPFTAHTLKLSATEIEIRTFSGGVAADVPFLLLVW